MSAKDNILHAMKWTVTDKFGNKMEVSNAVDGCVIFYPHNNMVQITFDDLEHLMENLYRPNTDFIKKNSEEKHSGRFPWGKEDPEKLSGYEQIIQYEHSLQEFAYNYGGELVKKNGVYVGMHIPEDGVLTADDIAEALNANKIPFTDIFKAEVGRGFDVMF